VVLSVGLTAAPAEAATVTARNPVVNGGRIWGPVSINNSDGQLSRACARLWWGVAVPPAGWQWIPVKERCINTPGTAQHFFTSGARDCIAGIYYTEAIGFRGSQVVRSDNSAMVSLGDC
jgi:hypothetical protein